MNKFLSWDSITAITACVCAIVICTYQVFNKRWDRTERMINALTLIALIGLLVWVLYLIGQG